MRRKVFISRNVGPSPLARPRERTLDGVPDRDDVVAIDDLAGHAVSGRAAREVLHRALHPPVRRERELVVLADEHDG